MDRDLTPDEAAFLDSIATTAPDLYLFTLLELETLRSWTFELPAIVNSAFRKMRAYPPSSENFH